MVCSLGKGRMTMMARLLDGEGFSHSVAEEVGHQKLVDRMIFKDLSEAVESNLLDEEDMNVFGLRPMADLLDLVCCNTCKKIIKTSQYAAHADRCRILKSKEQSMLAVDGSVRNKKATRKERKKSVIAYTNQAMPVAELERSAPSHLAINPLEAKNSETLMDSLGVNPGTNHNLSGVIPRPTKRSKLIRDEERKSSGHVSPKGTVSDKNERAHRHCSSIKDFPAPLATKIYYSQKKNRLRSALFRLYSDGTVESSKGFCSNALNPELSNGNIYKSQAVAQKVDSPSLSSVRSPTQMLGQSTEMHVGSSGVCLPPSSFAKHFTVDSSARPQVASGGVARNKFLSKPYPFTGNSGQSLGAVQQKNGSVPVL